MAVEIGALRALLSLDSAAFEKGAKRAQASMGNLQRGLTKTADRMKSIGRTMSMRLTAPIVAGTSLLVRSSFNTIDAQAKVAESMDTTVASLQVLSRAAETAGISQGDLDGSLRRMTRRVSLAERGLGAAQKALNKLNLSAEDLSELDAAERVKLIQERMQELVPTAEQAGVASEIFGDKTGLAMLRLDPSRIDEAERVLKKLGVTVSEVDATKIEDANDALSGIGLVTKGLGNQLAVALAPVLQTIAERIADLGAWFSDLSPQMRRITGIAVAVAAAIGPLAIGFGFVAAGLAAIASPVGLVILGLGALAGAAIYVATQWDDLVEKFPALGEAADRVSNALSAAFEGIKDQVVALKDIVNGALNGIIGIFTGDMPRAIEGFKQLFSGLKDFFDATVDAWVGTFDALLPGVIQALDDMIAGVIDWFVGIPERMEQLGKDMIDGLIRGMRGGTPEVGSAGRNAGRKAINSLKEETETQSPSKAFMRIGRDLMGGLGLGINQNTQAAVDAITQGVEGMNASLEGLGDKAEQTADRFGDMVASIVKGSRNIGDVLSQLGNRLLSSGISGIASSLFEGSGLADIFSGFLDSGGFIPRGKIGGVAENRDEFVNGTLVRGPARVTGGAETARMLNRNAAQRMGGNATLRIVAPEGFSVQQQGEIQGIALQITSEGLSAYDRETLPSSFNRIRKDPDMIG